MFIEKASQFTYDPGRGHTSHHSIVFYKHTNPPGFVANHFVLHNHHPCTVNRLNRRSVKLKPNMTWPNGNALGNDETTTDGDALGKQLKLWITPQSFKS